MQYGYYILKHEKMKKNNKIGFINCKARIFTKTKM